MVGKDPKVPGTSGRRRALLVGVRTYPFIPQQYGGPLAGCHNDVASMREVLIARGFDRRHIRVLVDRLEGGCDCPFCRGEPPLEVGSPTREGILSAVRELGLASGGDDVAVIYYSGHGSELSGRGLDAGQRFQTLVPHDSGRGSAENRDITDREIEGWIRDFHRRTPYLTLIFDCCHSGGVADLRGDAGVGAGRRVKADERTAAEAYAQELRQVLDPGAEGEGSGHPQSRQPARGASGWLRGAGRSAIVLSASAAKELSSETVAGGKKQGLFTHQLTRALQPGDGAGRTWAEIFPGVAEGVTAENLSQHPRREGNSPIFGRGEIDADDVYPPDVVELDKLAVVIGIDYQRSDEESGTGFPPLRTPTSDAEEMARVLSEVQGYEIVGLSNRNPGPLLNDKATRRRIHKLIHRLVTVKARTRRETAVVIYFAGHGVVRTGDDGRHAGYLVPWDADSEDPSTWLPMRDLRDQLVDGIADRERLARMGQSRPLKRLTSRHLLLVLDCCFGGALSFDFFRGGGSADRPIYYSEYQRFVEGTAWQLLTSASYNQQAMDRNPSDPDQPYSPFAQAVIDGLTTGEADSFRPGSRSDQIVTATELHQFVDARLKQGGVDVQTPGLMDIRPNRGQFIFHVPGFRPSPLPDPPLDPAADPWQAAVPEGDLFCGRELATLELLERFLTSEPRALAVAGRSGSGKTSLVESGLLPLIEDPVRGRQRYRSWLRRQGKKHYLVSTRDLGEVRRWAAGLSLGALLDRPGELAAAVRDWARDAGLDAAGSGAARIQARLQMESLGFPSSGTADVSPDPPGGVVNSADGEMPAWLRRLGLLALLDVPEELAGRLRLWLAEGGLADFLSLPDRALAGLVGSWAVVAEPVLPQGSDDRGALWVIDSLEEVPQRVQDDEGKAFAENGRTYILATVRADFLGRNPELRRALADWELWPVPRPTRGELLEVALRPAGARALVFEPPELVDRLVEEVAATPAPLPLLAAHLSRTYQRAWRRRGDGDRQLTAADLEPGGVAALLASWAEEAWNRLAEDPEVEPALRALFLRLVSVGGGRPRPVVTAARPVTWRELDLHHPAERRRLAETILPQLVAWRVVVAGKDHLELAGDGLIGSWERLRTWIREAGDSPAGRNALWRRALEWEESGFDRDKLWISDRSVRRLFRSRFLNRLERAFVVASEMEQRTLAVIALAAAAVADVQLEWQRSALLAAAAAEIAIDTGEVVGGLLAEPLAAADEPLAVARTLAAEARDASRRLAEQALHDVLAATPLSLPLALPDGEITGLRFAGDDVRPLGGRGGDLRLEVRIGGRGYAWNLGDPAAEPAPLPDPQGPEPGEGEVRPARQLFGPVREFPPVEAPTLLLLPPAKAQTGHDKAIWYFAPPPFELGSQLGHFSKGPRALLGHRGVPSFLAFSRSRGWLASAANLPGGKGEVRLWPIRELWEISGHPRSLVGYEVGEVFAAADSGRTAPRLLPPKPPPARPEPSEKQEPVTAFSPDGGWRAVGYLDGTVRLWHLAAASSPSPTPPRSFSVILRGDRREGMAVSALAFDRRGRRLAVERRAVYSFDQRRVDVYRLDLETLILLARGQAGRELEPADLPPEIPAEVFFDARKTITEEERTKLRQRYLATIIPKEES